MKAIDFIHEIDLIDTFKHYGRVTKVVGILIESNGPKSSIGDVCYIYPSKQKASRKKLLVK